MLFTKIAAYRRCFLEPTFRLKEIDEVWIRDVGPVQRLAAITAAVLARGQSGASMGPDDAASAYAPTLACAWRSGRTRRARASSRAAGTTCS